MKITDTRTTVVGTPWRELVFLELATDDGLVGLSEARMVSPGLGVRLNHDVCAQHPRTGGRIRLFEEGWEKRGT